MSTIQSLLENKGWYTESGPDADVVCSSRTRLSRNLSGFSFPDKLSEKELSEVQSRIDTAFGKIDSRKGLHISPLEKLTPIQRRQLIEKHFVSQNYSLNKDKLVVYDRENSLSAVVNEEDHLRLAGFAGGLDLKKAYERVNKIERELEQYLDFAVSLDKGYLSADIKNCGTGLQASVLMHLPALEYSSLLDRAFKRVMEAGYEIKGLTGNDEGSLGGLYELYNPVAIGESEKDLLEKLAYISSQLVDYERRAREELKRHRKLEIEDKVYRAWGTLQYCKLLDEKESFQLLSHVRLGAALDWLDVPLERINQLLVLIGKAHLQQTIGSESTNETSKQVKLVRANLVKQALGFASA